MKIDNEAVATTFLITKYPSSRWRLCLRPNFSYRLFLESPATSLLERTTRWFLRFTRLIYSPAINPSVTRIANGYRI